MKIQQTSWRIKIKTSEMKRGYKLYNNEHKTKSSQHSGNCPGPVIIFVCVCVCVCVCASRSVMSNSLWSHGLWAHQPLLSMEFSSQEYWSRLPFFSLGESSQPRDRIWVSLIPGRFCTIWAIRETMFLIFKSMQNTFLRILSNMNSLVKKAK